MTYLDKELSVHDGKPIELYKFEGTYENYYYTSAARKITYAGQDYLPIPLQRTEIAAGTENDDGLNITIDLPVTSGLIAVYGFEDSPPQLDLTIYRYHEIGAVIPYWIGPVVSITTNDGIGTVQSDSELATLLGEDFPNVYYQGPCNFTLFDKRCKVVEANYSGSAVLGVVNGRAISVDAIPMGATGIHLDGKLIGGEVKLSSGERRMIVGQAGVVITLNFAFSRTTIGDEVIVTAGCDHAYLGDCKTKFDNQLNNGGFNFIGTDNPFTDGVQDGSNLTDETCLPVPYLGDYRHFYWYHSVPCNTSYHPTRNLSLNGGTGYQPNPPYGKTISVFNNFATLTVYERDDAVNPSSPHYGDPAYSNLRGQLLVSILCANQTIEGFFYNAPLCTYELEVQYPAFYCGSVGLDGGNVKVDVCVVTYESPICLGGTTDLGFIGGAFPYVYSWEV